MGWGLDRIGDVLVEGGEKGDLNVFDFIGGRVG